MREMFVAIFFKAAHDGVYSCEYADSIATSHSTLIVFSAKIICRSKFHQRTFLSQFLSGNFMVEFLGQNFRKTCIGRQIGPTKIFINLLFSYVHEIYFPTRV
jgi:hypothetical protein